ncbi:MAG TPA: molybdopterin dinucleotide binding domain-containing protein, partial [Terriglobales bacterium]|nr:molybdopterin dinucleotide binding domain-containing protein [Terriglobales bacterium]
KLYFSTRRGKQFNSMTYGPRDPLTGARRRDDVFLNVEDARRLGLKHGDAVVVRSALGELRGHVHPADICPGNVQAYWPEGNVLIERRYDPVSSAPDYNVVVEIAKDGA